ncbi:MAG: hypothetical protein KAV87_12485, partial [Desulfobacteraceae bacterium]|nr:hypothetical protein [Desulfobacteraceae bacterium]
MRDALAERLLAQVMGWAPEDVARERPDLQAMAAHKYDEYQQFSPGMRFVESLAAWLDNFEAVEERRVAYDFIKRRLIFISEAEVRHLITVAYPDIIRPILLKEAASLLSTQDYQVAKIASSREFQLLCRKSLFLGLSDGAHIDYFRRASSLSNEQVHIDYRIENKTAEDLGMKLQQDIQVLASGTEDDVEATFEMVFLLNDFSASADTLLRKEDGQPMGKLVRAMDSIVGLQRREPPLVSRDSAKVFVVLYIATETAIQNLLQRLPELRSASWPNCEVRPVYTLRNDIKVSPDNDPEFHEMLVKYYDPQIMDSHLRKGGTNVICGYAGCALPLVLS